MTHREGESHMLKIGVQKEAAWETRDIGEPHHQSWTVYSCMACDRRKTTFVLFGLCSRVTTLCSLM